MDGIDERQVLLDIQSEMSAMSSRMDSLTQLVEQLLNKSHCKKEPLMKKARYEEECDEAEIVTNPTVAGDLTTQGVNLEDFNSSMLSNIMDQMRQVATGTEAPLNLTFGDDPSPQSLAIFIEHYNNIRDINQARMVPQWDDPEYRAKVIKCNLRGEVLLYVSDAAWSKHDEKLLERLNKHYSNLDIIEFNMILFEEAVQGETESLSLYLERLRELANDAYNEVEPEVMNMMVVVRFIQGLWDVELKGGMLEGSWMVRAGVAVPCEEILGKAQQMMLRSIGEKSESRPLKDKNAKSNGGEWEEVNIDSPSFFHKFLCGRGGVVKKRLEQETGTLITIPRPAEKKDYITVKGKSGTAISSLETRVESIVFNARKRERPSHFLCVPVVSDEITQNMTMLLDLCEDAKDITPDMIQKSVKLHFTIGVLRLFSEKEVDDARTALAKFAPQIPYILHGQPLKGELKGLDIMNDDPSSVKVLYSEVILHDESERLQMLVDALQTHFVESGLMNYEHNRESVKLHCTLINSKWKKDKDGPIIPFNATELMQYSDINFGEVTLGSLDFNEMKTDPETGGYVNCCRIKLDSK